MTAMLLAILRYLNANGRPPVNWFFVSTCDEELGGAGAKHLMDSGFRCDGIVVGEPTELIAIDRHKGAIRMKVDLHGRAGHSAYPESGTNAIHAAADFIGHLRNAVDGSSTSSRFEPGTGPPTLSVGTICGGDQVNRIPDFVTMEIDLRIPPGFPDSAADHWIAAASDATRTAFPDIQIAAEKTQRYPAFQLPAESPFRRLTGILSADSDCAPVRYATNAGFFAEAGLPCIIFGPGSVAHAHTADESIDLASVEKACEQLAAMMRGLGTLIPSAGQGML